MATLVVGWDGDVDELGGGVRVAEGDDGDVDVAYVWIRGLYLADRVMERGHTGFFDGLCVGARVSDDDEASVKSLVHGSKRLRMKQAYGSLKDRVM